MTLEEFYDEVGKLKGFTILHRPGNAVRMRKGGRLYCPITAVHHEKMPGLYPFLSDYRRCAAELGLNVHTTQRIVGASDGIGDDDYLKGIRTKLEELLPVAPDVLAE